MQVFTGDIKLEGDSDFIKKFNSISDWWQRANDDSLSEEEQKEAFGRWFSEKQLMEMGL